MNGARSSRGHTAARALCGVWLWSMLAGSRVLHAADFGTQLVESARTQIGVTQYYDASYRTLRYPGGDVPIERGVCSDVIIRAYRSLGVDLQVLIHHDIAQHWGQYPHAWGLKSPDWNIDHRRVPNLAAFFKHHGENLRVDNDPKSYRAGDIVTWRLSNGAAHIGLVSDQRSASGVPLVIHNIGAGTREENGLFEYTVTGHFRYRTTPP